LNLHAAALRVDQMLTFQYQLPRWKVGTNCLVYASTRCGRFSAEPTQEKKSVSRLLIGKFQTEMAELQSAGSGLDLVVVVCQESVGNDSEEVSKLRI
jgi:hypothetical protein